MVGKSRLPVTGELSKIDEIRRANLEWLIAEHGGSSGELSRRLGYKHPGWLAHLRSGYDVNRTYRITEKVARQWEERLRLPVGWMDTLRSAGNKRVDRVEAGSAIALINAIQKALPIPLTAAAVASLEALLAAEGKCAGGLPDAAFVAAILEVGAGLKQTAEAQPRLARPAREIAA